MTSGKCRDELTVSNESEITRSHGHSGTDAKGRHPVCARLLLGYRLSSSKAECVAVQCSTVQCSVVQCSAIEYIGSTYCRALQPSSVGRPPQGQIWLVLDNVLSSRDLLFSACTVHCILCTLSCGGGSV